MSRVMCIGDPNKHPGYSPGQWDVLPVIGEYYTVDNFFKKGQTSSCNGWAVDDSYSLCELGRGRLYPVSCFATIEEDENTTENEHTELAIMEM